MLEAFFTIGISESSADPVIMITYQENIAAVVSAWQAGEGKGGGDCGVASRENLYLHQPFMEGEINWSQSHYA